MLLVLYAQLAAQRFVNYWNCRREVFGPDKYVLRMTLAGALKDDLVALKVGPYRLLPFKDISGRSLIYWEPHRHTRKGYSSTSLRRAIWYTTEVAAQESIAVYCGIVQLLWERHTSLFDYDQKMHDASIVHYLKTCWPVQSHLLPTTTSNEGLEADNAIHARKGNANASTYSRRSRAGHYSGSK